MQMQCELIVIVIVRISYNNMLSLVILLEMLMAPSTSATSSTSKAPVTLSRIWPRITPDWKIGVYRENPGSSPWTVVGRSG